MRKNMKKRTAGPGGAGITAEYWEYAQRIRVGPVRLPPEEIDAETFKELLEQQGPADVRPNKAREEGLTTKEFIELYRLPGTQTRRGTRSRMDRIMDALEYFGRQEEIWWVNQQMEILRILDAKKHEDKMTAYRVWQKLFMERVKKAYKLLVKEDPARAREFLGYAYKFMKAREPQRKKAGSMVIIERVRRMALGRQYNELESFKRSLEVLRPKRE